MLVYGAVFALLLVLVPSERRRWLRQPIVALAVATGAAIPILAERIAERAIWGQAVSSGRVSALSQAAGTRVGARIHDAALTTFGFFADDSWRRIAAGACFVAALALIGWLATRRNSAAGRSTPKPGALEVGLLAATGIMLLARLKAGAGFVPGVLAAAPVAAAGAVSLARTPGRSRSAASPAPSRSVLVAATALLALPLVWIFAWQGQQLPQWGGRYELLSGVLLTVVGAVAIERGGGWRRPAAAALVAVSVAVAGLGAVWHVERARDYARAARLINDVPPDVVIVTTLAHLGREAGAFYGDRRWLAVAGSGDLPGALDVARVEGVQRVDIVVYGSLTTSLAGWRPTGRRKIPLHGFNLTVYEYSS
jgi:hypothetical protein